MDSIQATVGMAVNLQNANASQDTQMALMKKTMDVQKQQMEKIMEPVAKLATSGSVGTKLHVTA